MLRILKIRPLQYFLHFTFDFDTYYNPIHAKNLQVFSLRMTVKEEGEKKCNLKKTKPISFIYMSQHHLQMTSAFLNNVFFSTEVTENGTSH